MTLEEAFARLPAPADDGEGRTGSAPSCRSGDAGPRGCGRPDARPARRAQAGTGAWRRRTAGCAYLIGDFGWELGLVLGGLWLQGWKVNAVDPRAVAVSLREAAWEEDGETGVSVVIDLTIDPADMEEGGGAPYDLARAMTALLSPVVAALARTTRLGAAAQWRLVWDGLAGALIRQGRGRAR